MDWRLIEYRVDDAFHNMACDEAIFDAFCGGWTPSTVRFYGWDRPSISLGYLQHAVGPVDPIACGISGISVVRRPTGGRAVAHGTDFTFSIVLDARNIDGGGGITASYRKTSEAVIKALSSIGIGADFCSKASTIPAVRNTVNCFDLCLADEVAVCGIKVLGCAQMRRGNAVLQQNSLALIPPSIALLEHLESEDDPQKSLTFDGGKCPSMQEISRALKKSLEEAFDMRLVSGELSYRERQSLKSLETKYRGLDWTTKRPVGSGSRLTPKTG